MSPLLVMKPLQLNCQAQSPSLSNARMRCFIVLPVGADGPATNGSKHIFEQNGYVHSVKFIDKKWETYIVRKKVKV